MNDWVITTAGKVVRRDKAKPSDTVLPTVLAGLPDGIGMEDVANSFPTKEDAYYCRDTIVEHCPSAYLSQVAPKQPQERKTGRTESYSQEEFCRITRRKLIENYDVFWANFQQLKPRDACDVYMKMARYGFSTAPQAKLSDDEAEQRKQALKREQTAAAIADGLPDEDFDSDDLDVDAVDTDVPNIDNLRPKSISDTIYMDADTYKSIDTDTDTDANYS